MVRVIVKNFLASTLWAICLYYLQAPGYIPCLLFKNCDKKSSSLSALTIRIFWQILPEPIFCRSSVCLHESSLSYVQFIWLQYTLNNHFKMTKFSPYTASDNSNFSLNEDSLISLTFLYGTFILWCIINCMHGSTPTQSSPPGHWGIIASTRLSYSNCCPPPSSTCAGGPHKPLVVDSLGLTVRAFFIQA